MILLLGGCATLAGRHFEEPTVELVSLRPLPGNPLQARFEIVIRVVNPNNFALDIDGLFYEVYLRDRKVLTGASSESVAIPAFDEGLMKVDASVGLVSSLALIGDLLGTPPEDGLPYLLKTKISLGTFPGTIRLEHQGAIR